MSCGRNIRKHFLRAFAIRKVEKMTRTTIVLRSGNGDIKKQEIGQGHVTKEKIRAPLLNDMSTEVLCFFHIMDAFEELPVFQPIDALYMARQLQMKQNLAGMEINGATITVCQLAADKDIRDSHWTNL